MNKLHPRNFGCNYCCENKTFYLPRIKVSNTPSTLLPPVIVPSGDIIPTINRYFYRVAANIDLTNGATLPANLFSDDNNAVIEFKIFKPNGYVNLYINALMQVGGLYTIIPDSLTISSNNATIYDMQELQSL